MKEKEKNAVSTNWQNFVCKHQLYTAEHYLFWTTSKHKKTISMISIVELSILTLNIWLVDDFCLKEWNSNRISFFLYRGIPFVSKDRSIRVNAISKEIANGDYDVVSLQEVSQIKSEKRGSFYDIQASTCRFGVMTILNTSELLHRKDYRSLIIFTGTETVFWILHFFFIRVSSSGVVGSGLCILSKYPITMTLFHSWSVNGYVHRIQHGKFNRSRCESMTHARIYLTHPCTSRWLVRWKGRWFMSNYGS